MEISEVRVKLVNNAQERLKAFCSITLEDDFVIRDLKVIDGANGTFVAMPSRKLADRCSHCGYKNHLRAHYCNECGKSLGDNRAKRPAKRGKLHADIAHPINAACRERIQNIVIKAFEEELKESQQPGYKPPEFDFGDDSYDNNADESRTAPAKTSDRDAGVRANDQTTKPPPEPTPEPTPEPATEPTTEHAADGGGYDELIAELKSDAEARRANREETSQSNLAPEPQSETATSAPSASDAVHEDDSLSTSGTATGSPQKEAQDDFGAGIL